MSLKVTSINLFRGLWSTDRTSDFLEQSKPDLLAFQELTPGQATELQAVFSEFRYGVVLPQPGDFGSALLSRYPLKEHKVVQLVENGPFSIDAVVEVKDRMVRVIATHPVPPASPGFFRLRNKQLSAISSAIKEKRLPTIVLGDLNTSNLSSYFQKLVSEADLVDPRRGRGFYFSWPTFIPFAATAVDHILVSKDFEVDELSVGPFVWSDHLPVSGVVRLAPLRSANAGASGGTLRP